jgi:V/A-type H+/Na+-transporting ATPase subunit A
VPETPLVSTGSWCRPTCAGGTSRGEIARPGDLGDDDEVARVRDADGREHAVTLAQRWPVRRPRPFAERLDPTGR